MAPAERPEPTFAAQAAPVPQAPTCFRPFYSESTVTIEEEPEPTTFDNEPAAAAQPEPTFHDEPVAAAQSEPTFHDEPVAAAQPAPPAALAEPYYYTVDVGKRPHEMLGLRLMVLEQTLRVLRVYDEGTIGHWNKICQNTFPRDQVCAGDMIVRVNHCGGHQTMMNMLQTTESDLFIVMCRGGVPPPPTQEPASVSASPEEGAGISGAAVAAVAAPPSPRTAPALQTIQLLIDAAVAAPPSPRTPPHSRP
jgi:hypothetical protein